MLVLSRHREEVMVVGDDVFIKVIDIRGNQVRLKTAAPGTVAVHREEVKQAIDREKARGLSGDGIHRQPRQSLLDRITPEERLQYILDDNPDPIVEHGLILSRYRNEKIVVGDHTTITIVDIRGDKVRLGVEAPRELPIHRWEVLVAVRRAEVVENTGT